MKPSLQFASMETAEKAAEVLKQKGINYEIQKIEKDNKESYPDWVNFDKGGFVLCIDSEKWDEGMKAIWETNK